MNRKPSAFSSFFGGTLGVFAAIAFVVIGLPILFCGGCLTLGIIGSATVDVPDRSTSASVSNDSLNTSSSESGDSTANPSTASTDTNSNAEQTVPANASASEPPSSSSTGESYYKMKETVHVGYTTYAI